MSDQVKALKCLDCPFCKSSDMNFYCEHPRVVLAAVRDSRFIVSEGKALRSACQPLRLCPLPKKGSTMSDKVKKLRKRCEETVEELTDILDWHKIETIPLRELELKHIRALRDRITGTLELTKDGSLAGCPTTCKR